METNDWPLLHRAIREIRPGDEFNFYVPEDQLTAEFFLGDAATAAAQ